MEMTLLVTAHSLGFSGNGKQVHCKSGLSSNGGGFSLGTLLPLEEGHPALYFAVKIVH